MRKEDSSAPAVLSIISEYCDVKAVTHLSLVDEEMIRPENDFSWLGSVQCFDTFGWMTATATCP